jgi:hypothetical protein
MLLLNDESCSTYSYKTKRHIAVIPKQSTVLFLHYWWILAVLVFLGLIVQQYNFRWHYEI